MKNLNNAFKTLFTSCFVLIIIYGCTVEKKMDIETTKQAMKEMIKEAADSAAAREYRLTNTGQRVELHDYKCRYFITSIVKCDMEVENKSNEPIKRMDVWYSSYISLQDEISNKITLTQGDFPLNPGEKKILKITMTSLPEKAQFLEFEFKTNGKKHTSNYSRLNITDIGKSEY